MLRYIQIGHNSNIPTFNFFVGLGIAMAMFYLQYNKDFKYKSDKYKQTIHFILLLSIFIGFIGAFSFDAYSQGISITFSDLNKIGLTFYSGFIAGFLFIVLYFKLLSFPILETLNMLTPSLCIAHFVGRIGCFFAGCCFGVPTNSVFGITFPIDSLPYNHYHQQIEILPTQLFESAFIFILFAFFYINKAKNSFFIYIISYSIFRFLIEFIRADDRGEIFNQNIFTPSQVFSILLLTATIIIIKIRKISQFQGK